MSVLIAWSEKDRIVNLSKIKTPVVILFTSPGCQPCKAMEAILALLEAEYAIEGVIIRKCDAAEYTGDISISTVPRIFIIVRGRVFCDLGIVSESKLREELDSAIEEYEDTEEDDDESENL